MTDGNFGFFQPASAEVQWLQFVSHVKARQPDFFSPQAPIFGARAPGRLDVMGGVADYSGSIVLEMPLACAAFAAWQWRTDGEFIIRSETHEMELALPEAHFHVSDMVTPDLYPRSLEDVRAALQRIPEHRWASYVLGCFYIMLNAYTKMNQGKADDLIGKLGANILISSSVPSGAGISSSAAIEVATMHALSEAAGIKPSDLTLAAWCQRVENQVVGAPCGIMDQVTSALGRENTLLTMRCQPHDLMGNQPAPPGWRFIGIDSRVKHAVGGGHYTRARVGAFMGLKIIQLESGGQLLDNYLCRMSADEFKAYRELIPETLTGRQYQDEYGLLPDTVTRVDPDETYHPRACAEHPILDNERARSFIALMHLAAMHHEENHAGDLDVRPDEYLLGEAGALMLKSHESYSQRLNLGSPETDLLVKLAEKHGKSAGLYGARITGGGSGGTVAILTRSNFPPADEAILSICRSYEKETGRTPRVFTGSSPGAIQFGARIVE